MEGNRWWSACAWNAPPPWKFTPRCYRHVRNRQFHLGRTVSRVGGHISPGFFSSIARVAIARVDRTIGWYVAGSSHDKTCGKSEGRRAFEDAVSIDPYERNENPVASSSRRSASSSSWRDVVTARRCPANRSHGTRKRRGMLAEMVRLSYQHRAFYCYVILSVWIFLLVAGKRNLVIVDFVCIAVDAVLFDIIIEIKSNS